MGLAEKIRRLLGVEELENRIRRLEEEKHYAEEKLISAQQTKDIVKESTENKMLSEKAELFLQEMGIELTSGNKRAALSTMNASEAVERYGLKRYSPEPEHLESSIISLKELREHPEKYFHKLGKGFLNFPLKFNLDNINSMLRDNFGNFEIRSFDIGANNGVIAFSPGTMLRSYHDEIEDDFYEIGKLSGINRTHLRSWTNLDPLDFLYNFDGLVGYISEHDQLDERQKERGIKAMKVARLVLMTGMEILTNTHIRETSEMLDEKKSREEYLPVLKNMSPEVQELKDSIKKNLLSEMKDTTALSIDELVTLRSRERFRKLASERTDEILSADKERKGLTYELGKPIKDYTIPESIVLSCYFARNIIKNYEKNEDAIERVFQGMSPNRMSGKCSDYTGLALHYLREFLVPLYPEKFERWSFGLEKDNIGSYNHVYMKAIHEEEDGSLDVYFIDPTLLSKKGIEALRTPQENLGSMSTEYHPVEIQRDAEDFLKEKID